MATEKPQKTALERAQRTGETAASKGFDWSTAMGAMAKIEEEWLELKREIEVDASRARKHQEVGDLLFAVVNVVRHLDLDAEEALMDGVDRFEARFQEMERIAKAQGKNLAAFSLDEMEALWRQAKSRQEGAT